MSPPSGRMPVTRNEWAVYWVFVIGAPVLGWTVFGKGGLVTWGLVSVIGAVLGIWFWSRRR